MSTANLAYVSAANDTDLPFVLSIFADRAHVRGDLLDDALAAGFRLGEVAALGDLLQGEPRALGEVVLVDCPIADGTVLAALSRLDVRAVRCGAQLIVSTRLDALDDVFACLDQSNPHILVDPSRAERAVALGRVLGGLSGSRMRELGEEDRLILLRLTEQVAEIASRLDRLGEATLPAGEDSVFRFEAPKRGFTGADGDERLGRATRPALPDPRLVRRIIRQRQLRARFFEGDLFADPAWDMLLDLTAARAEHIRVSVTSLCIASGVPPTTALRWIGQLTEAGLLERVEDEADRRRAFINLTDRAADAMARYFAELRSGAERLV